MHLDATNTTPGGSAGSSGNVLRRLTIGGVVGTNSAAIAFGHAAALTPQVSEIDMYDLHLQGDAVGNSYYGIKILSAGNVKKKLTGGAINGLGANPGSVIITNSSWQGAAPADDVIIAYSGNITLIGNTFFNYRTATSYPKIRVGGDPWMTAIDSGANIISLGNWYQKAPPGSAPFFDGSEITYSTLLDITVESQWWCCLSGITAGSAARFSI